MTEVAKPAALAGRGGVWFRSGDTEQQPGAQLHLGVERPFRPSPRAHPGLLVADLDAAVGRLGALPGSRRRRTSTCLPAAASTSGTPSATAWS